ncbi:hypothetical protein Ae201684P_000172 [Aphanomyces euteiches]|uniref:Uncharacterized protein n=1 Tax=Aphanomyces euteiches TaxID=100861 RepID=A0A6G0X9W6_9STRA|nr:hypothetical protein Ae201684_006986 [Aphanomyces euteiches]KAH9086751.1 hypothetical protein Ae201684P_000172 [Aphanomyces euteiches]
MHLIAITVGGFALGPAASISTCCREDGWTVAFLGRIWRSTALKRLTERLYHSPFEVDPERMEEGFLEAQEKSTWIEQFYCKPCKNGWWGVSTTCRKCGKTRTALPLEQQSGIGWFECACGRKFAGFCRGNVRSVCHECGEKSLPSFVVPGDNASKRGKHKHNCEMCHGNHDCPIVASLKNGA